MLHYVQHDSHTHFIIYDYHSNDISPEIEIDFTKVIIYDTTYCLSTLFLT
jgi:hypothetical protein